MTAYFIGINMIEDALVEAMTMHGMLDSGCPTVSPTQTFVGDYGIGVWSASSGMLTLTPKEDLVGDWYLIPAAFKFQLGAEKIGKDDVFIFGPMTREASVCLMEHLYFDSPSIGEGVYKVYDAGDRRLLGKIDNMRVVLPIDSEDFFTLKSIIDRFHGEGVYSVLCNAMIVEKEVDECVEIEENEYVKAKECEEETVTYRHGDAIVSLNEDLYVMALFFNDNVDGLPEIPIITPPAVHCAKCGKKIKDVKYSHIDRLKLFLPVRYVYEANCPDCGRNMVKVTGRSDEVDVSLVTLTRRDV